MKNVLICNNCEIENPFYQLTCSECKSYLRARIVNIDFWDTIWKLLYTPVNTAKNIIQAENKNYSATCAVTVALKISLISFILMNAYNLEGDGGYTFITGIAFGGIPFLIFVSVFSFFITYLNNIFGIRGRVKDALSIYFFSFTPLILSLLVLTPIQIALFGEYWFTFNPSPFLIKPQAAVVILMIEILMYIWSGLIFVASTYAQTKNLFYSLVLGLIGFSALTIFIFYLSVSII